MIANKSNARIATVAGLALIGGLGLAAQAFAGPTADQAAAESGYVATTNPTVVPVAPPTINPADPLHAMNGTAQRRILDNTLQQQQ